MNTGAPPSKHQLALMIWLAVFPTLTVINLALGDWLRTLNSVVRTLVLATHRMRMLEAVDRIIVIGGGTIVLDGARDQILDTMRNAGRNAA